MSAFLSGPRDDELQEDLHLYMDTGETRGMLMIAPALLDHVTEELHHETNVLKERRKVRKANVSASSHQSTIDKQANEMKKVPRTPLDVPRSPWWPNGSRHLFRCSLGLSFATSGQSVSLARGSGRRQQNHVESWSLGSTAEKLTLGQGA